MIEAYKRIFVKQGTSYVSDDTPETQARATAGMVLAFFSNAHQLVNEDLAMVSADNIRGMTMCYAIVNGFHAKIDSVIDSLGPLEQMIMYSKVLFLGDAKFDYVLGGFMSMVRAYDDIQVMDILEKDIEHHDPEAETFFRTTLDRFKSRQNDHNHLQEARKFYASLNLTEQSGIKID